MHDFLFIPLAFEETRAQLCNCNYPSTLALSFFGLLFRFCFWQVELKKFCHNDDDDYGEEQ